MARFSVDFKRIFFFYKQNSMLKVMILLLNLVYEQ